MQNEIEARPATPEDVEGAWSSRDMAQHFGVPIQTVTRAAMRGSIPGCVKVLGRYVYNKEEALKWNPSAVLEAEGKIVRAPGGKFQAGNAFGVGNRGGRPKRAVELKFLRTLVDTVSPEDWADIIVKAVEQAKGGEWRARAWLSNYLLGTPIKRVQAEVDIIASTEFGLGERAAAIMALLNSAKEREEEKIVDGTLGSS